MSVLSFLRRDKNRKSEQQAWASPVVSLEDAVRDKRISSRLAVQSENIGDLELDYGLQIQGRHKGNITIRNERGVLWVDAGGVAEGDIDAPQVYVFGTVCGNVRADLVIVEGVGQIKGEVRANRLLFRNMTGGRAEATILARDAVTIDLPIAQHAA